MNVNETHLTQIGPGTPANWTSSTTRSSWEAVSNLPPVCSVRCANAFGRSAAAGRSLRETKEGDRRVTDFDFDRFPLPGIKEGGRSATGVGFDSIRDARCLARIFLARLVGALDPRGWGSSTVPRVHSPKPVTAGATFPCALRRLSTGRAARLWTPGGSRRGVAFLFEALA